jgi:hypothetical protein
MKSLPVKLGVILIVIGIAVFAFAEVRGGRGLLSLVQGNH